MIRAIKWWIFLTFGFFVCAMLTIWPIDEAYVWYRPQWVFMFVILCQVLHPAYFNPIIASCLGLLTDSLLGTPLGQYALVCSMICYMTSLLKFSRRPLCLQVEKILLLVCLGQILILWFHAFAEKNPHTLLYWMGSLSSCLVWPLFALFFQSISHVKVLTPSSHSL